MAYRSSKAYLIISLKGVNFPEIYNGTIKKKEQYNERLL